MDLTQMIDEIFRIVGLTIAETRPSENREVPIVDLMTIPAISPTDQVLRDFLRDLSAASIFSLLVIMYLGRGDFGTHQPIHRRGRFGNRFTRNPRAPRGPHDVLGHVYWCAVRRGV